MCLLNALKRIRGTIHRQYFRICIDSIKILRDPSSSPSTSKFTESKPNWFGSARKHQPRYNSKKKNWAARFWILNSLVIDFEQRPFIVLQQWMKQSIHASRIFVPKEDSQEVSKILIHTMTMSYAMFNDLCSRQHNSHDNFAKENSFSTRQYVMVRKWWQITTIHTNHPERTFSSQTIRISKLDMMRFHVSKLISLLGSWCRPLTIHSSTCA